GGAVFFDAASLTMGMPSPGLVGDVTVSNDPGQCGAQLQLATPASADNCGVVFLTNDYNNTANASDFYPVGTTVVTYTVGDAAGNTTSCSITVTVNDTEAPIAVCNSLTVQLDANGQAVITAADVDGGSSDNCGIQSISANPLNFDCSNVGVNSVTLTVTDLANNVSTCTASVTVEDNVAPNAVCQNIAVNLDASGNASITAADIDGGSTDNCAIASIAANPTNFDCSNLGNNTVTLTVTDVNGNVSTCTARVRVRDRIAPVALCQDLTVQLDATGQASVTAQGIDNGSSDNCGPINLSIDNDTFGCEDVGTASANGLIISEYIEAGGREDYLEIFNGTGAPVNLADYELQRYPNGNANSGNNNRFALSGTLADGAVLVLRDGQATGPGVPVTNNALRVTGDDALALFNVTTQTLVDIFGVIGEDPGSNWNAPGGYRTNRRTLRRRATVTSGVSVNPPFGNGAAGFATLASEWDVFSLGDLNGLGSHSLAFGAGNIVTLTVSDGSNNQDSCTAVVTVEDNTAPTVVCQDITVQLQPSGDVSITAMMVDGGTSDNCDFTLTAMPLTFDCDNVGMANNVTLTATDPSGNSASCTAVVTVVDTTGKICCPIALDFEESAMGNPMAAGMLISNQWAADGILISADNNRNNGPDQAILFNSAAPTGGDPDLGTPNVANGGPGIGGGGASTNFVPEDLILIIAERLTDNNNDGLVDNPDDEARGGSIRFDFTQNAATVSSIKLVDLDDGPWTIAVEILGGFTTSFSVNAIGDNATIDYPIGLSNVVALTVEMPKSGGIANLIYCPDGPDVNTCASTLDFNRDGMGNPLQKGVKLNNQWLNQGIRVSADNNQGPDEAITFNSALPTGGDPDLGTPNQAFGGPGVGNAGSPSNRIAEGNLLIIAENVTDNNNDGRVDNPDDDANGGTVTFAMTQTAFTIDSIVLVDIDENAPVTIAVEQLDQSVITFTVPGGGDNSKTTASIGVDSVVSVSVSFPGSGAIARMHYCEEGPVIPTPCLAVLDFETDGNGNPLLSGTHIDNQWVNFGVTIQTDNNRNNGPDQAIIFDSSNPTGGDHDLGTPNQQYGGPGIGNGGVTNNIPEGNTLIIAERLTDNNNNGRVDNPDDEARGGSITFTFNPTATVDSVVLIDVDDNTGWSAASCLLNNGQTLTMPIPNMGDNGRIVIPILQDSVQKLTINLGGSGSVAGLYFCADGPAPSNAKIAEPPVTDGNMGQSAGANLERSGLFTAFPNPFEAETTVRFELTQADEVTLVVFDMSGKMITTLYEGPVESGEAVDAVFAPEDVTDGIYLAKLVTKGGLVMTKKLMVRR
ncbi:MAG: HYR domain-containing protein, partial [Bacteroidota bacterium]